MVYTESLESFVEELTAADKNYGYFQDNASPHNSKHLMWTKGCSDEQMISKGPWPYAPQI
jgi:hypothetical protein